MLYEIKCKSSYQTEDGRTKKRTCWVAGEFELFAEAEYAAMQWGITNNIEGLDVCAIKRSPAREIVGDPSLVQCYRVTLEEIYLTDKGDEKVMRYQVLLFSSSAVECCRDEISKYLKQIDPERNSFTVVAIQKTGIIDQL